VRYGCIPLKRRHCDSTGSSNNKANVDYARMSSYPSQQLPPKQQAPTATQSRGTYDWLRALQAFRGLHDSVRHGRTLPCRARRCAPCNFSAHNINSNFETDAQPLLDCIGPYACGCTGFSLPKPHSTILTPTFCYNSTPLSETTHHAYASAHHNSMTPQDAYLRAGTPEPPGNGGV
jgi:hypothetical protein